MSRDKLSDDDLRLWSRIADGVEPLKSTEERLRSEARRAAREAAAAKPHRTTPQKPAKQKKPARPAPAPPSAPLPPKVAEDRRGRVAGLDRRTAERLRRGQYPIEARLDLHGMTQDQAHRALALFVRQCHAAGKRCLLVITGKGGRQRPSDDGPFVNPEPPGILKRRTPEWLKQGDLAPLVLSVATAAPAHGGGGALYILLKRRRET